MKKAMTVSAAALSVAVAMGLADPVAASAADPADELARDFLHPGDSARPWVYWFWLDGNITREGITANLEAMRRVGIGGVLIMEVDRGAPRGPARFGSPPWRELFAHACAEASRLGLQVNMNNDAGWCGSGGPWITPDLAMQKLVWTETPVEGPRRFDGRIARPAAVADHYRDISVLAFPEPKGPARIEGIARKAIFVPQMTAIFSRAVVPSLPADSVVPRDRIAVITARLGEDGRLSWDVPEGKWIVLRLGHTPTGVTNSPSPADARGLECDKLSREATDATSPAFTIQLKKLSFLIGGGCHKNETCINLIIDGRIVRTETGQNSEKLEPFCWDVIECSGRQATLQIVDNHRRLGAHHFRSDRSDGQRIPHYDDDGIRVSIREQTVHAYSDLFRSADRLGEY